MSKENHEIFLADLPRGFGKGSGGSQRESSQMIPAAFARATRSSMLLFLTTTFCGGDSFRELPTSKGKGFSNHVARAFRMSVLCFAKRHAALTEKNKPALAAMSAAGSRTAGHAPIIAPQKVDKKETKARNHARHIALANLIQGVFEFFICSVRFPMPAKHRRETKKKKTQ